MQLSDDTEAVINYLDHFTEGNLRKKNDLGAIMEICASYLGADLLNRLIFSGKSVWNISTKLRKVNPNADGIQLLRKEMERGCTEMAEFLKQIAEEGDDALKTRFNDIYLQPTSGAMKNLIDLAHDLAKLKELQSKARHGG